MQASFDHLSGTTRISVAGDDGRREKFDGQIPTRSPVAALQRGRI
jgi:hypothetical protein